MSKVKLYFHTGSTNHGCEAIVRGTINILNQDVDLFSFAAEEDLEYGVDKICNVYHDDVVKVSKKSVSYVLSAIQIKLFQKTTLHTKSIHQKFFNQIKKNDICLSIGGDNYTYAGTDILADYNRILKAKKAKTILWGCSIDEKLIPKLKPDLNNYNLIIARESMTYNALKKNGIKAVIKLCPDPAFQLKSTKIELPKIYHSSEVIGLNLSPLIYKYGDQEIILNNVHTLINFIITNTNFNIALIPHVVRKSSNDLEVLNTIKNNYKEESRIQILGDNNCSILKYCIANCKFFVGARTHSTIAAYSSKVPALAMGYSMKAKGIAKDIFGTYKNYVLPVQQYESNNELLNGFLWLLENEKNIRAHYEEMMDDYKKNSKNGLKFLKQLL